MRYAAPVLCAFVASCASAATLSGQPVRFDATAPAPPPVWQASDQLAGTPATTWLEDFGDLDLSDLVIEALEANPVLRGQYFTVRAAEAQARAVRGRTLPNISVGASAGGTSTFVDFGGMDDRADSASFGLNGTLNWEADLWGRLAAGIDAAEADLAASRADLAGARLSVAAQTVIAWFDLSEASAQQTVASATVDARERALELTERRFARGLSTALDVRTARTTLATAEATVAAREQAIGNAARRLEVLLGRYPENRIAAPAELPALSEIALAGTPSSLLARRPDIAAAEARLTAAGLRAEQARLALFPSINLNGRASTSEDNLADALDPQRLSAQLIASLAAPVFNGGALRAEREAALQRANSALEGYVSVVLTAWNEVEDAIEADTYIALQEAAQARALEEARMAEELGERQYANGLISIFNLIDLQTRRLNAESSLIAARSARASNRVRYHLALGGGLPVATPDQYEVSSLDAGQKVVLP